MNGEMTMLVWAQVPMNRVASLDEPMGEERVRSKSAAPTARN